jgi:hypothetical protein
MRSKWNSIKILRFQQKNSIEKIVYVLYLEQNKEGDLKN